LELGFNLTPDDSRFLDMRDEYLAIYDDVLTNSPVLFDGMPELLQKIEDEGITWGIVTNKPRRFTAPIMHALQLNERAACVICGDDAARPKPYPDTLLMACEVMQKQAKDCIYIGDAQRDIEAGVAAGMRTAVALYGYLDVADKPKEWGADFLIEQPQEILTLI
jgi:phosphoglycolate phosphatase